MIRDPAAAHLVHTLFETAAMAVGARYYWLLRRKAALPSALEGSGFAVLFGCLLGAAIGNKMVFWLEVPQLWSAQLGIVGFFLGGQSMVGGLLGGLLGVELAKRMVSHHGSTGDLFVFPVLLALMIGRVGCFLAGLNDGTFGLPTTLPWGVDFGDGIPRHPTQLYEIGFAALLWLVLSKVKSRWSMVPGLLWKTMLCAYLFWRLAIDGLKPVPFAYPLGLSGIQWVCIVALAVYLPLLIRNFSVLHRLALPHKG